MPSMRGMRDFFLFHRARRWNAKEDVWMGWERKRGKLEAFNAALRGEQADFDTVVGPVDRLRNVKYVIALDSDTQLPRDSARLLVGTMAHPLNRPVYDDKLGRVTAGYSILQPRIGVTVPSAARSHFARLFAGDSGIDPYTRATSDVYQDVFDEGSFVGKGIYDVDALRKAINDRFPENRILSHDLLEGAYGRAGLISDVVLFEDYPLAHAADVSRRSRWIRGDWQITPWLLSLVPGRRADAGRVPNAISGLSRWKILDNLRRSLVPVGLLAALLVGWSLPGWALVSTLMVVSVLLLPGLLTAATALARRPTELPIDSHVGGDRACLSRASSCARRSPSPASPTTRSSAWTRSRAPPRGFSSAVVASWNGGPRATPNGARPPASRALTRPCGSCRLVAVGRRDGACAATPGRASGGRTGDRSVDVGTRDVVVAEPADTSAPSRAVPRTTWRSCGPSLGAPGGSSRPSWAPTTTICRPTISRRIRRKGSRTARRPRTSACRCWQTWQPTTSDTSPPVTSSSGRSGRLGSMERMQRYRGHFYNWYDTTTLEPLRPLYVSTVDSGNLAGYLITLAAGLHELEKAKIFTRGRGFLGAGDYVGRHRRGGWARICRPAFSPGADARGARRGAAQPIRLTPALDGHVGGDGRARALGRISSQTRKPGGGSTRSRRNAGAGSRSWTTWHLGSFSLPTCRGRLGWMICRPSEKWRAWSSIFRPRSRRPLREAIILASGRAAERLSETPTARRELR